jgi:hypothetical protein
MQIEKAPGSTPLAEHWLKNGQAKPFPRTKQVMVAVEDQFMKDKSETSVHSNVETQSLRTALPNLEKARHVPSELLVIGLNSKAPISSIGGSARANVNDSYGGGNDREPEDWPDQIIASNTPRNNSSS